MELDFFSVEGGRFVGVGVEEDGVVVSTASPATSLSHPGPNNSLKISIFATLSSGFFSRVPKSHWCLFRGSSVIVYVVSCGREYHCHARVH